MIHFIYCVRQETKPRATKRTEEWTTETNILPSLEVEDLVTGGVEEEALAKERKMEVKVQVLVGAGGHPE